MHLKNIMLSERSLTEKSPHSMTPFISILEYAKLIYGRKN